VCLIIHERTNELKAKMGSEKVNMINKRLPQNNPERIIILPKKL